MKTWLTVAEAAVLIGRHPSRLYRWIDSGHLVARDGGDGRLRVSTEAVRAVEASVQRGRPKRGRNDMDEYTPSTDWIRIMVGYAKTTATDRTLPVEAAREQGYEWFDRWLAAHDREVRARHAD